ncbi:hypothetical protein ACOMHN_028432 [Nucella lapillus]
MGTIPSSPYRKRLANEHVCCSMSVVDMDGDDTIITLQEETGKRTCLLSDESVVDMDGDDTIINPDFLSSTVLEDRPGKAQGDTSFSQTEELKAAFGDPHVLEMISKAVAAQILEPPRKEIQGLRSTIEELNAKIDSKDRQILKLQDRVDELEQYGRQNSIRITSVPESQGESTEVVKTIFRAVDVQITDDMIDRTHRVGRKSSEADARSRPILVKCTSYRHKSLLMAAKKSLPTLDTKKLFPAADWRSLSRSVQSSTSRPGGSATAAAVPRV